MNKTGNFDELMAKLFALENPVNVAGQKRFGIQGNSMLGVSVYELRKMARGISDHELAAKL